MDSPSRPHGLQHRPKHPSLLARALSNQQASPSSSLSSSSNVASLPTSAHSSPLSGRHSRSSTTMTSSSVGASPARGGPAYATPPRQRPVFAPPSPASVTRGGSTVPFDFAASERAAREAAARDTPERGAHGAGREIVPRKRVIRRKSLFQRVKDFPSTVTDRVVFFSLNVNLDALARPLGLALAVLQFLLRAPIWGAGGRTEGRKSVLRAAGSAGVNEARRWEGRFGAPTQKAAGERWVNITTLLSLLLLLISALNALYLFSRTRAYRLQMRADPASVGSPNARVVDLDEPVGRDPFRTSGAAEMEEEDVRGWREKIKDGKVWLEAGKVLLPFLNPLPPLRYMLSLPPPSHPPPPRVRRNQAIELSIWQPPTFSLALFAVFAPASSLILHLLVPSAPVSAALCAVVVGYAGERTGAMWERRGRDREVLGAEVLREYDQQFVYPHLFRQRKEVGVMTHEAEMVW